MTIKPPLSPSYQKAIPDYERVSHYPEYWIFVEWMATPSPLRKVKSQAALAKELSLHAETLSRWKNIPEYKRDLMKLVAEKLTERTADVSYALLNRIFKDGSAAEVRLFREWAHEIMPTLTLKVGPEPTEKSQGLIKQLADEFEKKLKSVISKKDVQSI